MSLFTAPVSGIQICVVTRRDKIRCNGDRYFSIRCLNSDSYPPQRPCISCVKRGCECIERGCPKCIAEGKGSECIHRRSADRAGSPASGKYE